MPSPRASEARARSSGGSVGCETFLFHRSERQCAYQRFRHDIEQVADGIQLFGWQRIEQCVGLSALLIGIRFHGCPLS